MARLLLYAARPARGIPASCLLGICSSCKARRAGTGV
ncbi:MAG: 2Fe-2S iron-sulfur cluster-binding protein [Paracoccaceae bacterium]